MIQDKDLNVKIIFVEQNSVKSDESTRCIKLNKRAIEALPSDKRGKYIFCTKSGGPLRARNVQHLLDYILTRAGIPHKTTHVFRHTFASKLFEKGIDIKIISELLGHADVRVTYNTYITLIKKQKAMAMEAIEDIY